MLGRPLLATLTIGLLAAASAAADPVGHDVAPDEQILPPPPTYKANGVTVEEHLGARVPLDAKFRTQDGTHVTLGEVLAGELPTILTFNYSDCPMLCSLQLNGLTAAMPKAAELAAPPVGAEKPDKLAFQLGKQYRVVTISLEPKETLEKLQKMKQKYLDRLPEAQRAAARTGWTFLVPDVPGDDAAIRRVAETVGFAYTYIPERAEWAHPAAFVFLSTTGVVTRYVYGIDIDPVVMRESIFKAGLAEPTSAVGFMHRCYEYDPNANNYSHAGVMALRIAAVSCLVLLLAGLGTLHVIRRNGRRDASDSHDHNPRPDSPGEVS